MVSAVPKSVNTRPASTSGERVSAECEIAGMAGNGSWDWFRVGRSDRLPDHLNRLRESRFSTSGVNLQTRSSRYNPQGLPASPFARMPRSPVGNAGKSGDLGATAPPHDSHAARGTRCHRARTGGACAAARTGCPRFPSAHRRHSRFAPRFLRPACGRAQRLLCPRTREPEHRGTRRLRSRDRPPTEGSGIAATRTAQADFVTRSGRGHNSSRRRAARRLAATGSEPRAHGATRS